MNHLLNVITSYRELLNDSSFNFPFEEVIDHRFFHKLLLIRNEVNLNENWYCKLLERFKCCRFRLNCGERHAIVSEEPSASKLENGCSGKPYAKRTQCLTDLFVQILSLDQT